MQNNIMPIYEITYGFIDDDEGMKKDGEYRENTVQVSCCGGWSAVMDVSKAFINQLDGHVESPALVGVKERGRCLSIDKGSLAEIRLLGPANDVFNDDLAALHLT